MQDIMYLLVTIGFFGLMWLFVIGGDRIIGPDDDSPEQVALLDDNAAVVGGRS